MHVTTNEQLAVTSDNTATGSAANGDHPQPLSTTQTVEENPLNDKMSTGKFTTTTIKSSPDVIDTASDVTTVEVKRESCTALLNEDVAKDHEKSIESAKMADDGDEQNGRRDDQKIPEEPRQLEASVVAEETEAGDLKTDIEDVVVDIKAKSDVSKEEERPEMVSKTEEEEKDVDDTAATVDTVINEEIPVKTSDGDGTTETPSTIIGIENAQEVEAVSTPLAAEVKEEEIKPFTTLHRVITPPPSVVDTPKDSNKEDCSTTSTIGEIQNNDGTKTEEQLAPSGGRSARPSASSSETATKVEVEDQEPVLVVRDETRSPPDDTAPDDIEEDASSSASESNLVVDLCSTTAGAVDGNEDVSPSRDRDAVVINDEEDNSANSTAPPPADAAVRIGTAGNDDDAVEEMDDSGCVIGKIAVKNEARLVGSTDDRAEDNHSSSSQDDGSSVEMRLTNRAFRKRKPSSSAAALLAATGGTNSSTSNTATSGGSGGSVPSAAKRLKRQVLQQYPRHEKMLTEYLQAANNHSNNNGGEIKEVVRHMEQILGEIQTLSELAREKEHEWNAILHLQKVKEELLLRLSRRKDVLEITTRNANSNNVLSNHNNHRMTNGGHSNLSNGGNGGVGGGLVVLPVSNINQSVQRLQSKARQPPQAHSNNSNNSNSNNNSNNATTTTPAGIGGNRLSYHHHQSPLVAPPTGKAQNGCGGLFNGIYGNNVASNSNGMFQHHATGGASNNQTAPGDLSMASLNSGGHHNNSSMADAANNMATGRQGPIKDVKSIIADYRQRHPEAVPRRGRRMKSILNPQLGANASHVVRASLAQHGGQSHLLSQQQQQLQESRTMSELGLLLTAADMQHNSRPSSAESAHSNNGGGTAMRDTLLAELSRQSQTATATTNGVLGGYPDVTLHALPQSQQQPQHQEQSLLHGILTKKIPLSQQQSATGTPNRHNSTVTSSAASAIGGNKPAVMVTSGHQAFSPTLARLLTAPERCSNSNSNTTGGSNTTLNNAASLNNGEIK